MYSDRTALLIIRAWLERGSLEPLRARVRLTTDVSAGLTIALRKASQDWLHILSPRLRPYDTRLREKVKGAGSRESPPLLGRRSG